MSSIPGSIRDDRRPFVTMLAGRETQPGDRRLEWATWAFVALGVLLRIARYAMDYPLWWDEAFVAVNFIRRDYLDLLRPLDYGQVCPIFFLWAELTLVKLLGFSEWSLRLFPLVCAIASVALFRYAAGRVLRGVPLLMAVAIFAVAYHPTRHAADVKPYASDLLAGLALLAVAFDWSREPERAGRLWLLAAVAPISIALSHPAVFVAGGIMLGFFPSIARVGDRRVRTAYATFAASTLGGFLGLYVLVIHAQTVATLATMRVPWASGFPPLDDPLALVRWLVIVHTGDMFAYPCGGERGASIVTVSLFAVGAGVLWYRGEKAIVSTCLAPFGLGLVAAAIKRYPYGGVVDGSPARVMQYLVPSICLLAGLGFATLLGLFSDPRRRLRALRIGLVVLVAIGVLPLAAETFHPYRSIHAQRARQFARQFWPEFVREAEPVCLRWDLGLGDWDSINLNVAVYLCNQMIYAPHRREHRKPQWQTVSEGRPLRCVLPLADPADRPVAAWLDALMKTHRLKECRKLVVDMAEPKAKPRTENYHVYEFVPRESGAHEGSEDGCKK